MREPLLGPVCFWVDADGKGVSTILGIQWQKGRWVLDLVRCVFLELGKAISLIPKKGEFGPTTRGLVEGFSFLLLVLGVFVYLFVSVIIAVWNGKKEVGFKNEY